LTWNSVGVEVPSHVRAVRREGWPDAAVLAAIEEGWAWRFLSE
jgi:hypothetical protein